MVIKIYGCIRQPIRIPIRDSKKDITLASNGVLSFLIGSTELIEDVISECNTSIGKQYASIVLDSGMSVMIKITSNANNYIINVGELIG